MSHYLMVTLVSTHQNKLLEHREYFQIKHKQLVLSNLDLVKYLND